MSRESVARDPVSTDGPGCHVNAGECHRLSYAPVPSPLPTRLQQACRLS